MRRTRTFAATGLMILTALITAAGPVFAQVPIASHGKTGDWGYDPSDDPSHPAAKCGYSAKHDDGFAYLRWIKVRAPRVAARDITGGLDEQPVSWQVYAQRMSGSGWKTINKSAVHQFMANDADSTEHNPVKVYVKATNADNWRAVVRINWRRNGSTEGWIKARIEYYSVKWTVGNPAYVFTDSCWGKAD